MLAAPAFRLPTPAEPIRARKNKPLDPNHAWEVIKDPSGDFIGRCFQWRDLEASAQMMTWPEGIIFRHRKTREIRVYSHGAILKMGDTTKPIHKLFFNDRLIFSSTQKRVPRAVLLRYWPEIADDKIVLDTLATCPVAIGDKRLEWRQEDV